MAKFGQRFVNWRRGEGSGKDCSSDSSSAALQMGVGAQLPWGGSDGRLTAQMGCSSACD